MGYVGRTSEYRLYTRLECFTKYVFNPVVNAARGVAVQVQNIINGFVLNFQTAINPQIIKSYAKGKTDDMFKLIFASSKFSFLLLFAISLPVMIEAEILLNLWLKEVPKYTPLFLG